MAGTNSGSAKHGAEPLGADATIQDIEERVAYLAAQAGSAEPPASDQTHPTDAADAAGKQFVSKARGRSGCLSIILAAVAGFGVAAAALPSAAIPLLRALPSSWLSCDNLDIATLVVVLVTTGEAIVLAAAGVFVAAHWNETSVVKQRPLLTDARVAWILGSLIGGILTGWVMAMLGCAL